MPKKDCDHVFKFLIIGDYGVGKVDILQNVLNDNVKIQPKMAGNDFALKRIDIENKKIKLQIWDTTGQFCNIGPTYYRDAKGIILVYDITNSKSFDNLAKWLQNVEDNTNHEEVEKMILGNRSEMEDKRVITKEKGQVFAEMHGIRFLETSAKTKLNIDQAFEQLTQALLLKAIANQNKLMQETSKCCIN